MIHNTWNSNGQQMQDVGIDELIQLEFPGTHIMLRKMADKDNINRRSYNHLCPGCSDMCYVYTVDERSYYWHYQSGSQCSRLSAHALSLRCDKSLKLIKKKLSWLKECVQIGQACVQPKSSMFKSKCLNLLIKTSNKNKYDYTKPLIRNITCLYTYRLLI